MDPSNKKHTLTQKEATEVFMKYYGYVRGVAFASAPIASLSEDIAHDAFVCFIENATTWDYSEEKVKPLLKSITRNMAARAWKKQMRQTPDTLRGVAEFLQKKLYDDEDFHTSYISLEEKLDILRTCLSKLTPENRALLEKIYFEDASCVDLAEILGKTSDALYMQASRARTQLHQCVSKTMKVEQ